MKTRLDLFLGQGISIFRCDGKLENSWSLRCLYKQQIGVTEASPSDHLVSYLGHSLEVSYSTEKMQSVYSAASAVWATSRLNSKRAGL